MKLIRPASSHRIGIPPAPMDHSPTIRITTRKFHPPLHDDGHLKMSEGSAQRPQKEHENLFFSEGQRVPSNPEMNHPYNNNADNYIDTEHHTDIETLNANNGEGNAFPENSSGVGNGPIRTHLINNTNIAGAVRPPGLSRAMRKNSFETGPQSATAIKNPRAITFKMIKKPVQIVGDADSPSSNGPNMPASSPPMSDDGPLSHHIKSSLHYPTTNFSKTTSNSPSFFGKTTAETFTSFPVGNKDSMVGQGHTAYPDHDTIKVETNNSTTINSNNNTRSAMRLQLNNHSLIKNYSTKPVIPVGLVRSELYPNSKASAPQSRELSPKVPQLNITNSTTNFSTTHSVFSKTTTRALETQFSDPPITTKRSSHRSDFQLQADPTERASPSGKGLTTNESNPEIDHLLSHKGTNSPSHEEIQSPSSMHNISQTPHNQKVAQIRIKSYRKSQGSIIHLPTSNSNKDSIGESSARDQGDEETVTNHATQPGVISRFADHHSQFYKTMKEVPLMNGDLHHSGHHEDNGDTEYALASNPSLSRSQPLEFTMRSNQPHPAIRSEKKRSTVNAKTIQHDQSKNGGSFKEYFTKRKLEEAKEKAQMYNDEIVKQYHFAKEDEDEEMNFLELCDTLGTGASSLKAQTSH
eukprot:TRINITY_DN12856_c0_g2_i2.p1 TRINITY_DN12856_c0_g2~~TRINITY_DN12856_c0_g2_i2.p1  ORF type:complete len:636 (-),score=56.07 TRINITY_DN12856_c0_g2_i2:291-2198(-)